MVRLTFENDNFNEREFTNELSNLIKVKMNELGKSKIIWACVGEPGVPFDSIGPVLGSNLKKEGFNVIGTAESPLNVTGLKNNEKVLEKLHEEYLVIAIDACATSEPSHMSNIILRDFELRPGAGVGRDIPPVGHLSIVAATAVTSKGRIAFKLDYYSINKIIDNLTKNIKNLEEDGLYETCYNI